MSLTLTLLPQSLSIARLAPTAPIPEGIWQETFVAIVRTTEELSIVSSSTALAFHKPVEPGWRALKVLGPLDFALTGILASLTSPLAAAQISIFAISTFDTDYLLVREQDIQTAIQVLKKANHVVNLE